MHDILRSYAPLKYALDIVTKSLEALEAYDYISKESRDS